MQIVLLFLTIWAVFSSASWSVPVTAGTESAVVLEQPAARDIFSVAIIADRTAGTKADMAILAQAVEEVNRLNPDLVLHIGDMVNGYTYNPEIWKSQMREFKQIIGRLRAPFYPLAGNHDTFPGNERPSDRTNEGLYKQYFGPLYYSFDYANSHFVCLYSDEGRTSRPVYSEQQLAWLKEDLAACEKENIFVLSHKPSWEYRGGIWDPIHQILKEYPVRAVFGGHFHSYQKCEPRDGIQYYVLGATGGFLHKPKLGGGLHHITLLTVEGTEFSTALLEVGSVLPDDYVLARDYRNFSRLDQLYNRDTQAVGSVPDPVVAEVDTEVPVRIKNPLSEPVRVRVGVSESSGAWTATLPTESYDIAAGATFTAKVRLQSPKVVAEAFAAPEILITYLFEDSKGRTVPIDVRAVVPVERSLAIGKRSASITIDGKMLEPEWQDSASLPLYFWRYSMYDVEADAPPEIRLLFDGESLYLFAAVPDLHQAIFDDGPGERVLSDAVLLSALTPGGEAREFLFQVLDPDRNHLYRRAGGGRGWAKDSAEEEGFHFETVQEQEGYRVEAKIGAKMLFGEKGLESGRGRFNVSLYDNDFNPYPFVRRWTAEEPQHWGRLIVGGAE